MRFFICHGDVADKVRNSDINDAEIIMTVRLFVHLS